MGKLARYLKFTLNSSELQRLILKEWTCKYVEDQQENNPNIWLLNRKREVGTLVIVPEMWIWAVRQVSLSFQSSSSDPAGTNRPETFWRFSRRRSKSRVRRTDVRCTSEARGRTGERRRDESSRSSDHSSANVPAWRQKHNPFKQQFNINNK